MMDNANEHKNGDNGEVAAIINSLNKIFCNKECCADYIRAMLNKSNDLNLDDLDDLSENIASNIELVKKSANINYDAAQVTENATDAPKPEEFLNNGKFSGLPDEIKSAYLEKYFEIIDEDRFDYQKSFWDNLASMFDKYKDYPEGVFLHILRLRLENFKEKPNNKDNQNTDTHYDFASKKNLANAIKKILDSSNKLLNEKTLSVLWEYYECFNGIDENNELDNEQDEKAKLKQAIEKIIKSADFSQNKDSKEISAAIMTGKLRAYRIDNTFTREYIEILENYSDKIKIAVIESFKSATSPFRKQKNRERLDDICKGDGDYSYLSSAVRAKIIDKLSNNGNATGVFLSMNIFDFIKALEEHYDVDMKSVNPEILVALFKLFLNSPTSIGANITQVLTAILEIQKQTENFKKQVDLDSKLLSQLSWDLKGTLQSFNEQQKQLEEQKRQLRNAQIRKSVLRFFGKILFCLVFIVVVIPTLLIRWTLRFFWGILGWFINMVYCSWKSEISKRQIVKNLCWEVCGFFSIIGLVGAVARRWFVSDPLAICQIFKNLWYRFFGDDNDINNHKLYISGFIVWFTSICINGKYVIYRKDRDGIVHGSNFGLGDYFKFMSGYSEVINKSEAKGYPDGKIPLQSKLENINTRDSSPFRYY